MILGFPVAEGAEFGCEFPLGSGEGEARTAEDVEAEMNACMAKGVEDYVNDTHTGY